MTRPNEPSKMELLSAIDVVMSGPSFSIAWDLLVYGKQVDILYSPSGRQAFFFYGSEFRLYEYFEIGSFYVATLCFEQSKENLCQNEARILMKENLKRTILSHTYHVYTADKKLKRVYV